MNKPANFSTIGFHLLQEQLIWTFWFIGIVLLVNIVRTVLVSLYIGIEADYFYGGVFIASNIYMLIIGIISIYFLPYFVENGVTRKNYFYGNVIASVCLSILIPVFAYVITIFEKAIFPNLRTIDFGPVVDHDGNIIGDLIQSIILAPYVNVETDPLLSMIVFSINIFGFYIIGWLISATFYRLGVIAGLLVIFLGIIFFAFKDSMVRIAFDLPIFEHYSIFTVVPKNMALLLVFAGMLLVLSLIRLLTKRAPIKI